MRNKFLVIKIVILFISSHFIYSQTSASGYYIDNINDTIIAQIKLQRGVFNQIRNDFTSELEIVDNNTTKFNPNDLKEYGFTLDNIRYRLFSKPTKDGTYKFLTPIVIGPKSSLYQYGIMLNASTSTMSSNQVYYTFEKADGTYLFLKNTLNKKFRAELKEFYKDSKEAQSIIDNKLKYWLEITQNLTLILNAINNE